MSTESSDPNAARFATFEERAIWGICPVCKAPPGEKCNREMGFQLGTNVNGESGDGAHLGRLQKQHALPKDAEKIFDRIADKYGTPYYERNYTTSGCIRLGLRELATELTKGREEERVKHEAQLKAVKEDRDAILADRDSIRQQLAEAKEQTNHWKQECEMHAQRYNDIRAHNIALSAVVERTRTALEAARVHFEYCGYGDKWEREVAKEGKLPEFISDALSLQPDLSLYGRIVEGLRELSEVRGHADKVVCLSIIKCCHEKATQLLADLGQPSPELKR